MKFHEVLQVAICSFKYQKVNSTITIYIITIVSALKLII